MSEIITDRVGKRWIGRHNTLSMLRSLFMGKVWNYHHYRVVIREVPDRGWVFGFLATQGDKEVLVPLDMDINFFIKLMSDENALFDKIGEKKCSLEKNP